MIDLKKKYRTRRGDEVHLYEIKDLFIFGRYLSSISGEWVTCRWTEQGRFFETGDLSLYDLIKVRQSETRKVWINIYERGYGGWYSSKEEADAVVFSGLPRLSCIEQEITFTHGEGL